MKVDVKNKVPGLHDGENCLILLSVCIHGVPACDRRTDGQTDRQTAPAMTKSRSSIAQRGKNGVPYA